MIIVAFYIIITTTSSLIYKHWGQINGPGWDGTVITQGALNGTEAWAAAVTAEVGRNIISF